MRRCIRIKRDGKREDRLQSKTAYPFGYAVFVMEILSFLFFLSSFFHTFAGDVGKSTGEINGCGFSSGCAKSLVGVFGTNRNAGTFGANVKFHAG